jgi:hypothetical protein
MVNVFGPRPQSLWTPQEQQLGHGFAGMPLSDIGVQAGLVALQKGEITPAQFVDLNAKLGGFDVDINPTQARTDSNQPALERAYRSGAVNETNNSKDLAIIDLRGPDPGAFHDAYRSWAIRARLEREEGHLPRNQVIWFGETPLIGDPSYQSEAVVAMDRWLTAVEQDHRSVSLEQKVFPDGVCDWTKPGVDQKGAVPWQTYQDDAAGGAVIFGGTGLGPAPAGSGGGWTSGSFGGWRAAKQG